MSFVGVCVSCKTRLTEEEWRDHSVRCDSSVQFGWQVLANPLNTEWVPGYRFCVLQVSQPEKKPGGWRVNRHKVKRTYKVAFEIDQDGLLQWTGGVKARPETVEMVQRMYARERPGSNGGPALDD